MPSRFPYVGSGYLLLIRDGKILLQRRYNTGFEDGKYGVPAGHLDGNEAARAGAAREMQEELGITIKPEDLRFAHLMHRKGTHDERFDLFWTVKTYEGEIQNMEPEKCDELSWFPLETLPENTIEYVRIAIENVHKGIPYSEYGYA